MLDAGVYEMVKGRQNAYTPSYTKGNITGVCLCILSPIPLLFSAFSEKGAWVLMSLCLTLITAGVGVIFLINAGVRHAATQKLLQEGDYSPKAKSNPWSGLYWGVVTAVYLGWSFATGKWGTTWIIWPSAGVLFGGISVFFSDIWKKNR